MRKTKQNPLALSCEEVGQALGVHEETIRKRASRGEIPHHRIGDRWLIPRQWLNDVLEGNAAYWQPNEYGHLARTPDGFRSIPRDTQ
jgi:excisionase family DNA binding protein